MPQQSSSKKLLVLQTGAGAGHRSITQAIQQGLDELAAPVQVSTADVLPKQFQDLYAIVQKPKLIDFYHLIYRLTDNPYGTQMSAQISLLVQKDHFRKLIRQHQPDAILINSQFGIQELPPMLERLSQTGGRRIRCYVFIPDPFTPHRLCFSKRADLTLVPTVRTLQLALRYNLDPHRLIHSGHPIRQEFYDPPADIGRHRTALGLEPDPFTILFGASGDGSEQTLAVLRGLCRKVSRPFQAMVATGRNSQLKERLEQMSFPPNVRVKVYGYIGEAQPFADLFHAADLIAAKAGPNALFEAVAARKPFVATHYIKGQESGNRNYLIATGVGLYESKPSRIVHLLNKIIEEPTLLEPIRASIDLERTRHQEARRKIAQAIVEHLYSAE